MAKIPSGEGLGNRVAEPQGAAQIPTGASGEALFSAIGAGLDQRQQRMDREAAIQRQEDREAEVVRKANDRARANASMLTAQDDLQALHDDFAEQVKTGKVKRDTVDAEWSRMAQERVSATMEDMPPDHQQAVHAQLTHKSQQLARGVRKAVVQLDQSDTLAQINRTLESTQRMYLTNPKGAQELTDATLAELGPSAGLTAEQIRASGQKWRESTSYVGATALVNNDPAAALKNLRNPEFLPHLDPGQRTSLIHTADVRVTQAAQRAEIAAQAHERKMQREWQAVSTVIESGKTLDPVYARQAMQKFKGTPYEAALGQLMAEGPANASFVGQSIPMQRRALEELQGRMNREGATPELIKAYKKAETAHHAAVAEAKVDPYMAALERGLVKEVAPLQLDLQTLPQQLARRMDDATKVSQWVGSEVSLFRPQEAEAVAGLLTVLPPKDRAAAVGNLAKTMTPGQMRAFGQQLGSKDDTLATAAFMAATNARTTAGRPVAEIALAGADAIKEQRIKWPTEQTVVRQEIDKLTRGAFLSEAGNRAAGDAALAVYAGLLAEGKSVDAAQAVRLATGGIMDVQGQRIVKPYGWSDDRVKQTLRDYEPKKLAAAGPLFLGGQQIAPQDLAPLLRDAQLGPTKRPGAYSVSIGMRPVLDERGRPFVLPLSDEAR